MYVRWMGSAFAVLSPSSAEHPVLSIDLSRSSAYKLVPLQLYAFFRRMDQGDHDGNLQMHTCAAHYWWTSTLQYDNEFRARFCYACCMPCTRWFGLDLTPMVLKSSIFGAICDLVGSGQVDLPTGHAQWCSPYQNAISTISMLSF